MVIDAKGRIFGKVNIVDLTVLAILILAVFVGVKFIFFKPNFFQYKNMTIEANFSGIPLSDLTSFSRGKNLLYLDNDSYLILGEEDFAKCHHKNGKKELIYYFNNSYSILARTLTVNCTHDDKHLNEVYYFDEQYIDLPKTTSFGCKNHKKNTSLVYYFNNSYLTFPKKNLLDCSYDKKDIALVYYFDYSHLFPSKAKFIHCAYEKRNETTNRTKVYYEGRIPNPDEYFCDAKFLFKLKARIVDEKPFYYEIDYHLLEGRYFQVKVGDIPLQRGRVVAVYDNFHEKKGKQ